MNTLKDELKNAIRSEFDQRISQLDPNRLMPQEREKIPPTVSTISLTDKTFHTSTDTPMSPTPTPVNQNSLPHSQSCMPSNNEHTNPTQAILHTGTANDHINTDTIQFIPAPEPKVWMFVTRIAPTVTETWNMKMFILGRLKCTKCSVKCVIPRGRVTSSLCSLRPPTILRFPIAPQWVFWCVDLLFRSNCL